MSQMRRSCTVEIVVAILFGGVLGFATGYNRELQVLWWQSRLRSGVVNNPARSSGGHDFAMVEALEALENLQRLGAGTQARNELLPLIQDPTPHIRMGACYVLAELNENAIPALAELDQIARDPSIDQSIRDDTAACASLIRTNVGRIASLE
jgi:hypothetical protein